MKHLREAHLEEMGKNACKECPARFETAGCLKKHAEVVHGKKTVVCPRINCRCVPTNYLNFIRVIQ